MKRIVLALTLAISSLATSAQDFQLSFEKIDPSRTQITTPEDAWIFIASAADYDVLIDKSMLDTKQKHYKFHAVTVFKTPQVYNNLFDPVYKIYTYGYLRCDEKKLYLLSDWFVDINEVIVYSQHHDFGTYVTNLDVPNSVRNDVYNVLCGESI